MPYIERNMDLCNLSKAIFDIVLGRESETFFFAYHVVFEGVLRAVLFSSLPNTWMVVPILALDSPELETDEEVVASILRPCLARWATEKGDQEIRFVTAPSSQALVFARLVPEVQPLGDRFEWREDMPQYSYCLRESAFRESQANFPLDEEEVRRCFHPLTEAAASLCGPLLHQFYIDTHLGFEASSIEKHTEDMVSYASQGFAFVWMVPASSARKEEEEGREEVKDDFGFVLDLPVSVQLPTETVEEEAMEVGCLVILTSRLTSSAFRIGRVYTPFQHRGKGLAFKTTSSVAEHVFAWKAGEGVEEEGKVFLFADKNNPVSNNVYRKVGFEAQESFTLIKLCEKQT